MRKARPSIEMLFADETKRDTAPANATARAKGLKRVPPPFSRGDRALAQMSAIFRALPTERKKRRDEGLYASRAFISPRASPLTFACIMHVTKLNNVALGRRILTSQYRVYASLCSRRQRDLRTIIRARASAPR